MAEAQPEGEHSSEPQPTDLDRLRAEFEKEKESWEQEKKKLHKLTTEAQQDASEATKMLKRVLPKLNALEEKPARSFEEDWEQSPEGAVEKRVERKIAPVMEKTAETDEKTRRMEHKMARLALMNKFQDFTELEPKIAEISQKDPVAAEWSWTEEGLEKLYRLAKYEKLEKMVGEKEVQEKVKSEKERAFTEDSEGGNGQMPAGAKSLSPQERRMARALGLDEKTWQKWSNFGPKGEED